MNATAAVIGGHPEWRGRDEEVLAAFAGINLEDVLAGARQEAIRRRGIDAGTLIEAALEERLATEMPRRTAA